MSQYPNVPQELCAWCGTRAPHDVRQIRLITRRGTGKHRRSTHLSLELPVCKPCETYAQKLEDNFGRLRRDTFLISLIPGLALSVLMFTSEAWLMVFLMWPFVSVFFWALIWVVLAISGLDMQLRRRGAGAPPQGYASKDETPCSRSRSGKLHFSSKPYHARFVAQDPEWAWQSK